MTRALLAVASTLLALTPTVHGLFGAGGAKVDTKADAQIHLYSFASNNCIGGSINHTPHELKQGQCVNIHQANSVRPRFRPDHAGWVDEVNALRTHCQLKTFAAPNCLKGNQTTKYRSGGGSLPKNFEKCLVPRGQLHQRAEDHDSDSESSDDKGESLYHSMQSAMFICGDLENPEQFCTSTLRHTSWYMDPTYWSPHSQVHTATYTGTLQATASIAARSGGAPPEDIHPTLEPRMKPSGEQKGVWMYHPWEHSLTCYSCYPKHEHDYRNIECRAGINYPVDCGAVPVLHEGRPTTHHTTTTSTTTAVTTTHHTSMTAYSRSVIMFKKPQPSGPYADASDCFPPECECRDCALHPRYADCAHCYNFGVSPFVEYPDCIPPTCFCPDCAIDPVYSDCWHCYDFLFGSDGSPSRPMDIKLSQKKSWHTPVKFWHPFISGKEACADAEWEKRGRPENYVKIQHVHLCDKKDRLDSQWIGLPKDVVHTKSRTTTSTHVIDHTSTSTETVVVTRRHDQL